MPAAAGDPQPQPTPEQPDAGAARAGRSLRNGLIALGLLVALAVSLLLAVPGLHGAARAVAHLQRSWLALAVGLEVLSCLGHVLAFLQVFGVITLVLTGIGSFTGLLPGPRQALLSIVPAAVGAAGFCFVLALPRFTERLADLRAPGRIHSLLTGTSASIRDTPRLVFSPDWRLLGAIGHLYLRLAGWSNTRVRLIVLDRVQLSMLPAPETEKRRRWEGRSEPEPSKRGHPADTVGPHHERMLR